MTPEPEPGADARGRAAVRLARRALVASVQEGAGRDPVRALVGEPIPEPLRVARGVFVTLARHPGGRLRGCIGFPLPVFPLYVGIPRAAAAAALEDPRFPPVTAPELDRLVVEVSLLTVPEPLDGAPGERPGRIVVGRDGLIVEAGASSGLLLPQVAPEQGWDAVGLLEGVCEKADLPRDAWRRPATRVLRFEAQVYRETAPGAPGERHDPSDRGPSA
ncbi:MAG TPA: TIGR00296 family protein [Thermoplasmata archaeon]|nr:TIGR00296 family protein [Thermoplasmata archaeon]